MSEKIYLFCDNGIVGHIQQGGKGIICSAYCAFDINGKVLFEGSEIEEDVTNNYGEMKSIKMGVLKCLNENYSNVKIFSDSELCVRWLNGEYQVKSLHIQDIHKKIIFFLKSLEDYSINWISRDNNLYADWLTSQSLQHLRKTPKKILSKEYSLEHTQKFIKQMEDKNGN